MRNEYTWKIRLTQTKYMKDQICKLKGDKKGLYKLIAKLTGLTSENPLHDHTSDMELSDEFANFFIGQIAKIRDSLDQHPLYDPPKRDAAQRLSNF